MLPVIQGHLAAAAVAAARALLAEVIIAIVLCASDADSRGFLFADATSKWHVFIASPIFS
jgi:hypothetical protein